LEYTEDADAIITQFANISKKVIQNLKKCRIIARYAIGVDTIDVEEAKKKGIVVSNVPDYCIEEVSDSAIAHILNCVRKISFANRLFYLDQWSYDKIKPIHRFSDQVLGLIAFGNIARRVAEKLRPFEIKILAYDPYFSDFSKYDWIDFVSIEELLKKSDIISVHAPLNKETYHFINRDKVDLMKGNTIIVNTSRGGVIDEKALEYGLENQKIALAGLDVLEYQDNEYYHSVLKKYPERVVITPHISWYSEKSIEELQRKTASNVYEMLKNGKPLYSV
ncbi:MAG: C-terminal binding protein, partial [Candidatus Atribacteria bacterium]|nr:C-terminal binding protein [Candidatus Atribacteria bacterium]